MPNANFYAFHHAQEGLHPKLDRIMARHRRPMTCRPIAQQAITNMTNLIRLQQQEPRKIILDCGIGKGLSLHYLASNYPDHRIIGIDKSRYRLAYYNKNCCERTLVFQGQLEDYFVLCHQNHIKIEKMFIFYPNPYPKMSSINQRLYGSSMLPYILHMAKEVIVRSNALFYLNDMMYMYEKVDRKCNINQIHCPGITHFDRKYASAGVSRYELRASSISNPCDY